MHSACSAILPGATRLESCFIGPAWVYSYLGHWEIHPERRSYLQKWLTARRTMETCQNILIPFASSTSQNKVQEGETHVNINPWYTSIRDILLFNEVLVLSLEKKKFRIIFQVREEYQLHRRSIATCSISPFPRTPQS